KDKIRKALERSFRPEFLNRIDEIIIFNSLTKNVLKEIVGIQLERMRVRTMAKGIDLSFGPGVKDFLAEKGFDPHYGARPLKRAIQNFLLNPLAQEVIAGKIKSGDKVSVEIRDGELEFSKHGRMRILEKPMAAVGMRR
ncbi:MAG: ATP-dependent Clp protease ATP-binding subunit, partial [Candidatus Sungbacteria bacterium]|nr:ATP-dependent Clp protease ATP-binding subunit [Candidatus Sungbacteria bacterium]